MARPTTLPRWAETAGGTPAANITEPTEGKKDVGYVTGGDIPSSGGKNWWMRLVYNWLAHFANEAVSWPAKHAFSAGLSSAVAPAAASDVARLAEVDAALATAADAAEAYTDARFPTLAWTSLGSPGTGWTAGSGDSQPAYFKDAAGVVHLRGSVTAGATATTSMFPNGALPAGCRPVAAAIFRVAPRDGAATPDMLYRLGISSLGALVSSQPNPQAEVTHYLDGISFVAEQ